MISEARGHSSQVHIRLQIDDQLLPVSQVGEDSLILREPFDLPPSDAMIVVVIDGDERRFPVRIRGCSQFGTRWVVRFYEREVDDDFSDEPKLQQTLFNSDPDCPF